MRASRHHSRLLGFTLIELVIVITIIGATAVFTVLELLVALVLGALVASGIYQALVGTQRASHTGMQQIEVQENLRAGVGYLSAVLRELDAAEGDLSSDGKVYMDAWRLV